VVVIVKWPTVTTTTTTTTTNIGLSATVVKSLCPIDIFLLEQTNEKRK